MIKEEKMNELTEITKQLNNALNSNPKNEKLIINILNSTNNAERQIIRIYYKKLFNTPIQKDIKQELKNNFKELCISMFDTPYEYDARELNKSLNSPSINYNAIIEIFASRKNSHLNIVEKAYEQFFKIPLKDEISKKLPKIFSKFLLIILDINRNENNKMISYEDAYDYAKVIKEKDIKIIEDENLFKNIFLEKSRENLILISRAFYELYKINLYEYFKNMKNDNESIDKNKKLIKNILFFQISPSEYFCKKIKKAISGLNTDFNQLSRVMVYRANIDMEDICDLYLMDKRNDLYKDILLISNDSYGETLSNLCLK